MAGIFDTGIFDTGIFDHPPTGTAITGVLAATEAQDAIAVSGTVVTPGGAITGILAATEAQDAIVVTGKLGHVGTLLALEAQDVTAVAGMIGHVGTLAATEAQDYLYALAPGAGASNRPPPLFIVNVGRMMGR